MSMKVMYDLKDMLCAELDEIGKKGEMSAGDLETVHKLTDTIKNIDKITMLEESGYSRDEDYSRDGDWSANMRAKAVKEKQTRAELCLQIAEKEQELQELQAAPVALPDLTGCRIVHKMFGAGTAVPFAPAKRVVDVDRMRDIIDEVRNNLPDEIRESKKIVNDREQIMKNAQVESETIIQKAEERAGALVSEQEIVKRSRQRAAEILTAANTQAKDLTRNATVYCETLLKKSEETLARSVADIKNTRMNLRSATRSNRGGQGGQNQ